MFHGYPLVLQQALCLIQRQLFRRLSFSLRALLPLLRDVGCLCLPCQIPLFGPLRTSLLCSDPLPRTSLCQQCFVCLFVHVSPAPRSPLVPVMMPPETVLVLHGTLRALQPSLCLSLIRTEPLLRLSLCPTAPLPYSLPFRTSPFSRSSPEDIAGTPSWVLHCVPELPSVSLSCSRHPSSAVTVPPEAVLVPRSPLWLCSAICTLLAPENHSR